jgi:hypothetical protein
LEFVLAGVWADEEAEGGLVRGLGLGLSLVIAVGGAGRVVAGESRMVMISVVEEEEDDGSKRGREDVEGRLVGRGGGDQWMMD